MSGDPANCEGPYQIKNPPQHRIAEAFARLRMAGGTAAGCLKGPITRPFIALGTLEAGDNWRELLPGIAHDEAG